MSFASADASSSASASRFRSASATADDQSADYDDSADDDSATAAAAKLISMLAIFGASLAVGCAPIVLARCLRPLRQPPDCQYGRLISLLLCFGGGVLLFTTFLHLLPECRRHFAELERRGRIQPVREYFGIEISEICVCCGFFVVFAFEETVHFVLDRRAGQQLWAGQRDRGRPGRGQGGRAAEPAEVGAIHRTMSMRRCTELDEYPGASAPSPQCRVTIGRDFNHILVNGRQLDAEPESLPAECPLYRSPPGTRAPMATAPEVSLFDHPTDNSAQYRRCPDGGAVVVLSTGAAERPSDPGQSQTSLLTTATVASNSAANSATPIRAVLRALVAVLALSVHGVFEGLAVGLEQSAANVWYMCVAIATHKLVVAFCVGMELVGAAVLPGCIAVYVAGFAVVTPLGMALGMLVSLDADGGGVLGGDNGLEVVAAVLQAMAAGTLLYVIFFEVLARDRAHPHRQAQLQQQQQQPAEMGGSKEAEAEHARRHHYHPDDSGFYRLFAIVAGFLVMFVLHLVTHTGHEHTHGGSDGGAHGHSHSHSATDRHDLGDHGDHGDHDHFGHAHSDHHHHGDPTTTTTAVPGLDQLRALPQLVTDLAGAMLAQTRQPPPHEAR